ncbi:prepilin-type N-terminal cleavage/methylation domain-containing protein [Viridibacillus sp. YIM B01967]|uniref:ComG operon protein 3 n=1 Tax=Viridibacillus soli TaxID=2798301 RepID=A0ABS1H3N1_9BACL|nr:competence type IV pilus major pilin ComGC [Viridibacillus soli]MBK3494008.1 prepilin-type N-terminal cleavage/methylation domain-containing protein [Viridibacillus soli]
MHLLKQEKAFTLIEMLIVLFIITVLILIAIPNVTKHFSTVDDKGCKAYVSMVQGQVEAYRIDEKSYPATIDVLRDAKYLKKDDNACSGKKIQIIDGAVSIIDE